MSKTEKCLSCRWCIHKNYYSSRCYCKKRLSKITTDCYEPLKKHRIINIKLYRQYFPIVTEEQKEAFLNENQSDIMKSLRIQKEIADLEKDNDSSCLFDDSSRLSLEAWLYCLGSFEDISIEGVNKILLHINHIYQSVLEFIILLLLFFMSYIIMWGCFMYAFTLG